ncbi:hypothetical protein ACLJJ6_01720 [Pediococcus siamensis]|uniref:hypothetical protein n=1 Tax=Pediococcus siamensis TaxID=381829 RepID=UPI0039A0309E
MPDGNRAGGGLKWGLYGLSNRPQTQRKVAGKGGGCPMAIGLEAGLNGAFMVYQTVLRLSGKLQEKAADAQGKNAIFYLCHLIAEIGEKG